MQPKKFQKWNRTMPTLERLGNFLKGEEIEGSITIIGIAQIVNPGMPSPLRKPETSFVFKGKIDMVNEGGDVTRINLTREEGKFQIATLDELEEYYFQC